MPNSSALLRTMAVGRVSVFFLLFGEYKVAGLGFAHGGCQAYLQDYIATSAGGFYRRVLSGLSLPPAILFAYLVGVVERLVGISLFFGLFPRPACILGILFWLHKRLATWREPGQGVPLWRHFGAERDRLGFSLLIILFAADAGRVRRLDGRRA